MNDFPRVTPQQQKDRDVQRYAILQDELAAAQDPAQKQALMMEIAGVERRYPELTRGFRPPPGQAPQAMKVAIASLPGGTMTDAGPERAVDLSSIPDEELMRIAGVQPQTANQQDLSSIPDEELMRIAGVQPQPAKVKKTIGEQVLSSIMPSGESVGAAVGGFADTATFGAAPYISAVSQKVLPEAMGGAPSGTPFKDILAGEKGRYKQMEEQHPVASTAGSVIAAIPGFAKAAAKQVGKKGAEVATTLAGRLGKTAALGAAHGVNIEDAKSADEVISSALGGAGVAVAGYGLGAGLGKAFDKFGATQLRDAYVNKLRADQEIARKAFLTAANEAERTAANAQLRHLGRMADEASKLSGAQFKEVAPKLIKDASDVVKYTKSAGQRVKEALLPESLTPWGLTKYSVGMTTGVRPAQAVAAPIASQLSRAAARGVARPGGVKAVSRGATVGEEIEKD